MDLSNLAPGGAKVRNTARTTSGAVSFMDTFSQVTGQIGQHGRRGALMLSMDCKHPDLMEFIKAKSDLSKVNYANCSVRISDDFMRAVENDDDWTLSFTRPETGETIEKTYKADEIFTLLCKMNWDMGEPGCLFWDRITSYNILSEDREFEYAGVNPCGEEPLPAGGSCLLGSLNLSAFVEDSKFQINVFKTCVAEAVVALNEVLMEGLPRHPLQEQRDSVDDWRQIGLGVMGIADMLIKLKLRYGSPEAVEFCDGIGDIMATAAISGSNAYAVDHGAYPQCRAEDILESPFMLAHCTPDMCDSIRTYGMANSQLCTIAPTGTLSTMLGISGGIEPIYANYYTRTTKSLHGKDVEYKVYAPIVKKYVDEHGDENLPDYFVTAQTLSYTERIAMQQVWQKHIDAAISSTVNAPNSFTVEDTKELYMLAWKSGLKGLTMFRDGCARAAILSTGGSNKDEKPESDTPSPIEPESIPRGALDKVKDSQLIGLKTKLLTGCGNLHVQAFFDSQSGKLCEVFLSKGSTGGCICCLNATSRLISHAMQLGDSSEGVIGQLESCGACPSYVARKAKGEPVSPGSSCPVAVGRALKRMCKTAKNVLAQSDDAAELDADNDADVLPQPVPISKNVCPECGEPLIFEGGCNVCKGCGWSKCM